MHFTIEFAIFVFEFLGSFEVLQELELAQAQLLKVQ